MVSLHNGPLLRFLPQVYKVLLPHSRHGLDLLVGAFGRISRRTLSVSLVLLFDLCFFFLHVKTTPGLSGKLEFLIRGGKGTLLMMSLRPSPSPTDASGPQQLVFQTPGVYSKVRLETVTTVSL